MPELTETGGRLLKHIPDRERCAAPESSETGVSREGESRAPLPKQTSFRIRNFFRPTQNFLPVDHSAEYLDYLKSEHWAALRTAALNKANRKCEACSNLGTLHGHHLLYRRPLTDGIPDDIMALCDRCHDVWHDWIKQTQNRLQTFTREATRGAILVLLSSKPKVAPVVKSAPQAFPQAKVPKGQRIRDLLLQQPEFNDALKAFSNRDKFHQWLRKWAHSYKHISTHCSIVTNGLILQDEWQHRPRVHQPSPHQPEHKFSNRELRLLKRATQGIQRAAATRANQRAKQEARKAAPPKLRSPILHGPLPETRAWFPDGHTSVFK